MSDYMTPDKCEANHGSIHTSLGEIKGKTDEILEVLRGDMVSGKIGLVAKVNILWAVSIFLVTAVAGLILKIFLA